MDHYKKYRVEFDNYTKRHFEKSFEKKYRGRWEETRGDIVRYCERIEKTIMSNRAKLISSRGHYRLAKMYFTVIGTRLSPKASGNRCILVVDDKRKMVRILLVYSKHDISTVHETAEWKKIIKEQFHEVSEKFGL